MNPLRRLVRAFFDDDADATPGPDDLVVVAESGDGIAVVEMWQGMLESAGIRSVVRTASALRFTGMLFYPSELLVRYADLDAAREILRDVTADRRRGGTPESGDA